eukprot:432574-Pyramimonas_sp.AAC.1
MNSQSPGCSRAGFHHIWPRQQKNKNSAITHIVNVPQQPSSSRCGRTALLLFALYSPVLLWQR